MLIINNEDVSKLLTMADCIRVQEEAFKKLPYGGAIHRPRIDMYMPCDDPNGYYRWSTMEGANDALHGNPDEVRCHQLAAGCQRQLD